MNLPKFKRLPEHIGLIPDGNRRWAAARGLPKEAGYESGVLPGFEFYEQSRSLGIKELTLYGFTQDNTKRPSAQTAAFRKACVEIAMGLTLRDAALLVVGNTDSPLFPEELLPLTRQRQVFGKGSIRVNLLVNYGWLWDLSHGASGATKQTEFTGALASNDISRIDLVIRWGGRRRLSGFLPVQSVYSDFYFLDDLWPDYHADHLLEALTWYEGQDVTLGG
ncbi:Undecaprenyl diphosphate synthase [Desulfovibrio sp. DV]|uniref:undecaprenyl diphosphate synthase family protein n=1 Tax=Desulfovibrio sp. DV TaxID=1844708 RepID=UPI00094BA0E9|nr:undecaprenyl diphosphate synthase family protein [Desulfovibrio sp. DV]OLN30404.1 Undecaprenyl diphosphate synthase [Desulfovibrio sp. DV]